MTPLPFDYARCAPMINGPECDNCARWARHPQQTWGERTPQTQAKGPGGSGCRRIEIKEAAE